MMEGGSGGFISGRNVRLHSCRLPLARYLRVKKGCAEDSYAYRTDGVWDIQP